MRLAHDLLGNEAIYNACKQRCMATPASLCRVLFAARATAPAILPGAQRRGVGWEL